MYSVDRTAYPQRHSNGLLFYPLIGKCPGWVPPTVTDWMTVRESDCHLGAGILLQGMAELPPPDRPRRAEMWFWVAFVALCAAFHLWGVRVGWTSRNLPGIEFRQAQTALSAYHIQKDNDFSLAYPTPVLGKPWSIPMEFPLYQWTVVGVSNATGLDLTKSGRLVSIVCFYLCLPAVFLLLGRVGVAYGRRWLVIGLLLTCPLYVFYVRGFLIETMALMFSLWFWHAFMTAVDRRSLGWLVIANLAGAGAGAVKVTTYLLYLIPAGGWALVTLWRAWREGRLRPVLGWMVAATAAPFALTYAWLRFADTVKARNPMAHFLTSDRLQNFNLGTWETRLSPEMWAMKGRIVAEAMSWLPALVACALVAVLAARPRWREIVVCSAVFASALVIFPELYALHEYYFVANTVLIVGAMGLALVGLAETRAPRWVVAAAALAVAGGQVYQYFHYYFPQQRGISHGGNGLTMSLRELTRPEDVIVITGQDWDSFWPFFSERRALMLRVGEVRYTDRLQQALANLRDEKIGALLVADSTDHTVRLSDWFVDFGIDVRPLYRWKNMTVYLQADRRAESTRLLQEKGFHEVEWAPGAEPPPERLAGEWFRTADLLRHQLIPFQAMSPQPVRFFASFGPALDGSGGRPRYNAHPMTRLVFALPAGRHVLRTTLEITPPVAYDLSQPDDKTTDGVEVTLRALGAAGESRVLHSLLFDPRARADHRGIRPWEVTFELAEAGEVELFFGPGPNGRDTCDWIMLGALTIEPAP